MPAAVHLLVFCLVLGSSRASGSCACQCIEGVARTICTTVEEAAAEPAVCAPAQQRGECPQPPAGFEPRLFEAPVPGAEHCREARLLDPATGGYTTTTRVCDTVRTTGAGR